MAQGDDPPPDSPDVTLEAVISNETEVNRRFSNGNGGSGGVTPSGSTEKTVGSWKIRYGNAIGYGTGGGSKYVRHEYARTEKVAGSGSYQAEAHATLIKGSSYTGQQVFSYFTHPCAQSIVNNAKAQSCTSPWFQSSTGQKWCVVSGHYFDIAINGSKDSTCDGCIDWIYTTH